MLAMVWHLCCSSALRPSLSTMGSVYFARYEYSVNTCVYVSAGCYMHLLLETAKSNCWVTICMKNVCGFIIMQKVSDTPARTNETFLEKTNLPFCWSEYLQSFLLRVAPSHHTSNVNTGLGKFVSPWFMQPLKQMLMRQIRSEATWGQSKGGRTRKRQSI